MSKKIITILGPTASGKSELAVRIAKKFNGEVISADSRQVYRGMDIGTGKITKKEMRGVPHHLLDVASPKRRFTVAQYRKLALRAINKIFKKGKTPIICGGTGFYIQAVIDGLVIPEVKPDPLLRRSLDSLSAEELFKKLRKLDPRRAKNIDRHNKRRLVRALEIVIKTKKPVPVLKKNPLPYPVLMLGIKKSPEELKKLIKKRLLKRLRHGMTAEVKKLHENGVSWKRLEDFGLEYRWIARYLTDFRTNGYLGCRTSPKIWGDVRHPDIRYRNFEKSNFFNYLQKDTEHYAKRQMTWFKRDKRIHWVINYQEAEKLAKNFLSKNKGRPNTTLF